MKLGFQNAARGVEGQKMAGTTQFSAALHTGRHKAELPMLTQEIHSARERQIGITKS